MVMAVVGRAEAPSTETTTVTRAMAAATIQWFIFVAIIVSVQSQQFRAQSDVFPPLFAGQFQTFRNRPQFNQQMMQQLVQTGRQAGQMIQSPSQQVQQIVPSPLTEEQRLRQQQQQHQMQQQQQLQQQQQQQQLQQHQRQQPGGNFGFFQQGINGQNVPFNQNNNQGQFFSQQQQQQQQQQQHHHHQQQMQQQQEQQHHQQQQVQPQLQNHLHQQSQLQFQNQPQQHLQPQFQQQQMQQQQFQQQQQNQQQQQQPQQQQQQQQQQFLNQIQQQQLRQQQLQQQLLSQGLNHQPRIPGNSLPNSILGLNSVKPHQQVTGPDQFLQPSSSILATERTPSSQQQQQQQQLMQQNLQPLQTQEQLLQQHQLDQQKQLQQLRQLQQEQTQQEQLKQQLLHQQQLQQELLQQQQQARIPHQQTSGSTQQQLLAEQLLLQQQLQQQLMQQQLRQAQQQSQVHEQLSNQIQSNPFRSTDLQTLRSAGESSSSSFINRLPSINPHQFTMNPMLAQQLLLSGHSGRNFLSDHTGLSGLLPHTLQNPKVEFGGFIPMNISASSSSDDSRGSSRPSLFLTASSLNDEDSSSISVENSLESAVEPTSERTFGHQTSVKPFEVPLRNKTTAGSSNINLVSISTPQKSGSSSAVKSSNSRPRPRKVKVGCEGGLGFCDVNDNYPKNRVGFLASKCRDLIAKMYVLLPDSFEEVTNTTLSARQGSACSAEKRFIKPGFAIDDRGKWQVIIQTASIQQRIPIELCRNPHRACVGLSSTGRKSHCLQKFSYQLLVALDPERPDDCPSMKAVRVPTSCTCQIEANRLPIQ